MNPFKDTTVTNDYDQVDRTRVTNVASRVHETARTGTGGTWASTDRDITTQPGTSPPNRTLDTRKDPPYGVFARHAIRGLSVSVYGATNATWDTTTYWAKTWARSNTVMGCADCHTVDGVNGTAGNAHGANSEYLLKDASGGATEGTLTGGSYVCYICHVAGRYDDAALHTSGNAQDFQDYTGSTGAARKPLSVSGGNIYGYACGNCHGGGAPTKAGATLPVGVTVADGGLPDGTATGPIGGYGTIHGTSQVIGIGQNGGAANTAYRSTYRFLNGNSMRYYDPGNWTSNATARGCYTLDTSGDQWGGCNKHGAGTGITTRNLTPVMQRPLKY
jgi:hypothetical protein